MYLKNSMTMTKKSTTAVRVSALLGIAVLFSALTIPCAFGADAVKAEVPFPFHVGAKMLPAGEYEFRIDYGSRIVTVVSSSMEGGAKEIIITTLGPTPHANEENHAHIIFDKVGTTYTLSEIWQPGADGVLVYATKGPHEHHVLHLQP
jgi:hypothetical protein